MYRSILVALDGSKNAEKVLPILEPVLLDPATSAVLLQVIPEGVLPPTAAAQAYLRSVSGKLGRQKIKSESEIATGDAASMIIDAAERRKVDLVAFTSHGQGGLTQWVFGGVAQKILRGCSQPLLIVRSLSDEAPPIKRIMLALDGSPGSEATLPHAVALARAYSIPVQLLHVVDGPGVEADDSKLRGWLDRQKQNMETRFCEIERAEPEIKFEQVFDEGDPATCIVNRAEKQPDCIIALGSHGRTALSRWMFGSVSEKVIQVARVPVLVARNQST